MKPADLDRNFSPQLEISESQSLVTDGVFTHIRHPMYAAHILYSIAQALLLQNWIVGPSAFVSIIGTYVLRTPREEKMMIEHFGKEYQAYMKHTGKIIPRF